MKVKMDIQEESTIIWTLPNYTMTELLASIHRLKVTNKYDQDICVMIVKTVLLTEGTKHVLYNYKYIIIYANIS